MRTLQLLTPTALALATLFATPAATAGELAGVTMPESQAVGDQDLSLNGMGLRTKFFVKVYVAGLYLPEKTSDATQILGADTARHMEMHFLHDVDRGKLCGAWNDGLEANTPDASAALAGTFETELCGMMSDVVEGDSMSITYIPGEGTSVSVRGEDRGTIEGRDFADALFACWLGPEPPNEDLKEGLLGR